MAGKRKRKHVADDLEMSLRELAKNWKKRAASSLSCAGEAGSELGHRLAYQRATLYEGVVIELLGRLKAAPKRAK